jgi:tRNA pseudouridine32 synthase/23S rRNA pseudouridine746 synthase
VPEPPFIHVEDAFVVLDKPAGLCVIPARRGDPADCLRRRAEEALGAPLFVVHRIDRDTSGVVLMARTAEAHRILNDQFAAREVAKEYRALVAGEPPADAGSIEVALAPGRKGRVRPARSDAEPGRRDARTDYRVLARHAGGSAATALVAFEPLTGRRHQIRVHARAIGCPIVGDRLYAPQVVRALAPRLMLHALALGFRHPASGAPCRFAAEIPPDFESVRQRLATA